MREITEKMERAAKKYITTQWQHKYGFLEPFEIDKEKIEETTKGIYLKCICHYPDCPTMAGKVDPAHPYARIRADKLNSRTQVACGACSKKARQLEEYKYPTMKVGDTIGCWHLDSELVNKELKQKMNWTGNSKYYRAHCIYCGLTDYKNSDHLKVGDASCVCRSGSFIERRINNLLKLIFQDNKKYFYTAEYGLNNQRVDFAILTTNEEPVLFIEYDGEFHEIAEMTKGELGIIKERDSRKDSLAAKLNIPVIRINYREQNKITENWLREQIENNIGDINS